MDARVRARLTVVVAALLFVVSVATVSVSVADEPVEQEPPSELVCEGFVQTIHNDYAPEADVRGAPATARAALARFLSYDHGFLRASDFRQTRGTAVTAHFVHDATGRPQVTAEAERYGDGWLVMELAACDAFLAQESRR